MSQNFPLGSCFIWILRPPTPDYIGDALGSHQRQFCKEALFFQYDKNKDFSLLSAPTPIKSLPEETKVLCSLIAPSIKEGDCSDAWKCVTRHCANVSSHIKGIDFDQSYSPVAHAYSDPTPIKSLPEEKELLCSLIAPSIKEGDCSDAWKFVARHCANGSSQIKGIDFDQSYSPVAHAYSFRINISIESMHRLTAIILDVSNAFQNKMFLFMKGFVSVHLPIILTGLKDRIQMFL